MRICCYNTGIACGIGLLVGAIGAPSGCLASKILALKLTMGTVHGFVSGFFFGTIAKGADYALPAGKCHQISAQCVGFVLATSLGYGVLKGLKTEFSATDFFLLATLTSGLGITILFGAKMARRVCANREWRHRSTTEDSMDYSQVFTDQDQARRWAKEFGGRKT